MARPTKFAGGFNAGIQAAARAIREQSLLHYRNGKCNAHQLAEWQAVAAFVEASTLEPNDEPNEVETSSDQ